MVHATSKLGSNALKKNRWLTALMVMVGFSVLFPVFAQYLFSFILLVWITIGKKWREIPSLESAKMLHIGVVTYLVTMVFAAVLSGFYSPFIDSFKDSVRTGVHFTLKSGLVWLVLFVGLLAGVRKMKDASGLLRAWAVLFTINFVYMLVQRYTGIDWTHGFGATLPPNRFAYGVYRVSGFMGHPLTLSFNLVTLFVTFVGLRLDPKFGWSQDEARLLTFIGAICGISLLVTGSRWPFIVAIASIGLSEGRRLLGWYKQLGLGATALGVFLFFEKSIIGRFSEVLSPSVPIELRFERLVFWKVHAKMFLDYPVFGVGMGASEAAKLQYYSALGYNGNTYNAHNVFLQTLADSGLIGLSGLLVFVVSFLMAIRKIRGKCGEVALRYVWVSMILGALMQNTLRDSEYIFSIWFSLSLIFSFMTLRHDSKTSSTVQWINGREST